MIHQLKITYGARVLDGSFGVVATYAGYGFDTDTLSIVAVSGTWRGAFLDPTPPDVDVPEQDAFWFDCREASPANDYEAVGYFHVRSQSSFRTELVAQCAFCGYTPPVTPGPTCELAAATATVVGQQVTLSATGARGPLRFSLDDGLTRQSSRVFSRLSAGDYVATIFDTGTPDCRRTVSFRILGAAGPLPDIPAPVGAPESLSLAYRSVFETITGFAPGTVVKLELWLESRHQERDYAKVVTLQKVAGTDGSVTFQVDGILRARLRQEPPIGGATAAYFLDQPIRNYFCRTKQVDVATGLERDPQNRPLRTVLLAGLEKTDSFGFLTNQPNGKPLLPGQLEWLYLLTPRQATATVRVRRALVLAGGQAAVDEEVVDLTSGARPTRFRLLAVPALPLQLPAGAVRAEVQVVDEAGEALTEIRVYQLTRPVPSVVYRQFLFTSPFGGLDTLVTQGPGTSTLEVKTETAVRGPQPSDGLTTPLAWHWAFDEARKLRVATGWLSPEQLHWLQGFTLARQIWYRLRGRLEPILPLKRQLGYQRDQPQLEGLAFEFELAGETATWEELR